MTEIVDYTRSGQETILRWYFDSNGQITGMQQQPWQGLLIDIPIEKLLIFRSFIIGSDDEPEDFDTLGRA